MPRTPFYEGANREWRSDEGRSNRWRDVNEGHYGSAVADRDLADDYRFLDHGARQGGYGGSFGQGRYGEGGSLSRFEMGNHGIGPKNYQRTDERLREMISEALYEDAHIDASDMTVEVREGRVILEGTVDSRRTRDLAEDLAERFSVVEVHNNLRVRRRDPVQSSESQSNP